ncbi:disintegrin and metalloproteinase domain-containing protein 12-like [Anthonomus grandis grandis]|uniref:disintegrin and metalloproteinase domain-containing protein 12-like n=1 Tax=Anthonomus grandis grandis TaxID=2921223 RepID=UPI002165B0FB|nr:disintegrin and metalloproteinase domain-containing protein 12-like [Anthonomus grandis grandis]
MALVSIFYVRRVVFLFVIVVLQGAYTEDNILVQKQRDQLHPASDFSRHTLVKPKIYHGREKRQITSTKEETGYHTDHIQIKVEVDGEDMILDLVLNRQLIPQGFFHKQQENGKNVTYRPTKEEINHCHYHGKVRDRPNSWVAISTCDGLSGVIFDGKEMHYVEKNRKNNLEDSLEHFSYKHSDLVDNNKTCGYVGGAESHQHSHSTTDNRFLRYKRSTDESKSPIRGPYNANKESKYVELVIVVDNREFKELEESTRRVLDHCKNIANIINGLYSPLNIFIALVGVVIWSEHDEITFSKNGDDTLKSFLHYRKDRLILEHPNDNAQLLTKFSFDQGVVGKALKGPMCTYEYSGGVSTDHSPTVGLVATTIAHEMGHNFGMEHDTTDCQCPDERCIMAPSSSTVAPTHWSSCSLDYLLLAFSHGMDYCLKNKPKELFEGPVCGNGFVENGEECDCGLLENCDNPCCNASTCMLHPNASCATGECCDFNTCKPKSAGNLCRSADYECDLPEYCTGQSEFCPPDIYKMDTEECDGGRAFCYHGFCRTRNDQCRLLWGDTGKSSDDLCYSAMNIKGNKSGNCGYSKIKKSFTKCNRDDVLCGMLHCKHLNERLEFGMETVAILSHSFINKNGSIMPCRTVLVDLGLNEVDPGMTPDGAKCGDGKMCVNQKCMTIESLRQQTPICKNDCNGNGWCNSLGHCHCKDGFAPPYCEYPGPGGSEDSGPASDPNARQGVIVALLIIFLGVIPSLAIVALLLYYAKYNLKLSWNKSPSPTCKSPNKSRGPPFPNESTKRTEANHSLLHEDSPPPAGLHTEFFGNFKGFSLTPLKKEEPEPVRPAPAPPAAAPTIGWNMTESSETPNYQKPPPPVPSVNFKAPISNLFSKPVQKMNSFRNNTLKNSIKSVNSTSTAPALPPLNPGSTARPIISSPVLESSTSNAKEIVSPLRNAGKLPVRPAPEAPKPERPLSNSEVPVVPEIIKKDKENLGSSTINRIASFLKSREDKKASNDTNSLTKNNQVKAQKVLDKETLRTLKISDPVPQTHIEVSITTLPVDAAAKKAVVMRAQSMKTTKPKERPNIPNFGSMRQPAGYKRPLSIPSGARPKSPPPPAPPLEASKSSSKLSDQYDDCLNEAVPLGKLSEENSPTSGDNIYAVIDETPSPPKVKEPPTSDGFGLLGEIVSEIQNRNFDSIYSTSTLNRKKKAKQEAERKKQAEALSPDSSEYANSSIYKSENEYSNMGGSTTSSGYILPSAVNAPPAKQPPTKEAKPVLSSFRKDASTKPFGDALDRSAGPSAPEATPKKPTSDTLDSNKTANKSKTVPSKINKQITPPNLRGRKPSPTRPLSQTSTKSSRSVTNSPDLVTSCNTSSGTKNPDVVGGGATKKPSISAKPSVAGQKPNVGVKVGGFKQEKRASAEVKPPLATKVSKTSPSDVKTSSVGLKHAARSNSNVASLQQKFEEKNNMKTAPKVKS